MSDVRIRHPSVLKPLAQSAGALRLQCIHKWVMRRNAGRLEVHWSFLHLWNQDDNGMASIRLGAVADKN